MNKDFHKLDSSIDSTLLSKAKGVPLFALREWDAVRKQSNVTSYTESSHFRIPHVIKFSGGRSSGLMLLTLLKSGALLPERGDVILFTNTAAEHPSTYDFVSKMKTVSESVGIPFFIVEFMTVETVINGVWCRRPTYRLVNDIPYDKQTAADGYRWQGEVFSEAVTWSAMLPTVYTRTCTTQMKMLVTRLFLADYFGSLLATPRLGHFNGESLVDPDEMYIKHIKNKGTMTQIESNHRWSSLSNYSTGRASQRFIDYSEPSHVYKSEAHSRKYPIRKSLFGKQATKFITFLGFRSDEIPRYQRMVSRNSGIDTPGHNDHPPGEFSLAPLYELGIDQSYVLRFWQQQPSELKPLLPDNINLSNCVYCFLKGPKNLTAMNEQKEAFENTLPSRIRKYCIHTDTPNKIMWWAKLESSNSRKSKTLGRDGKNRFGMFGLNKIGYHDILSRSENIKVTSSEDKKNSLPDAIFDCECTD